MSRAEARVRAREMISDFANIFEDLWMVALKERRLQRVRGSQ